jgi:hypothetical protein
MRVSKRKEEIKRFARRHALAVTFYDVGLCAIFEKAQAPAKPGKRMFLLAGSRTKAAKKRRG